MVEHLICFLENLQRGEHCISWYVPDNNDNLTMLRHMLEVDRLTAHISRQNRELREASDKIDSLQTGMHGS